MKGIKALAASMEGAVLYDGLTRTIYATDASEYEEMPMAVAFPKNEGDLRVLLSYAKENRVGLITRAAGTSLAGQVVGNGIVVDMGRNFTSILGFDKERRRVRVQPGVVRNELNLFLRQHGLFFAPETSTANRAMIGGMVGNNSCGANSIVYGSTRDHLVSAKGFLSDGSLVTLEPLTRSEFTAKCEGPDSLETRIYQMVRDVLANAYNRHVIRENFPKPAVMRRNTGYALDSLLDCEVFVPDSDRPFNLCRLIAGSEGTLFIGVEFELNCEPLPPPGALMCVHFGTVHEALRAAVVAMGHRPSAVELIDRNILECAKSAPEQSRNRMFVVGDPGAILVIEMRHEDPSVLDGRLGMLEGILREMRLGWAFPVLRGGEAEGVWELRRAGQGVMSRVRGDARPREIVEDTAVAVEDLPSYIAEFSVLMRDKFGIDCVYYAHAGAGELHTRPLFNLKSAEGVRMFRAIALEVAALVRKYRGSLSGEHGDGRLRGEFIRYMVGDECFALMRGVKTAFDPSGLLNPGKIIDTPPMDRSLREHVGRPTPDYETFFRFRDTDGVVRAAERCNGSGDCRKSHLIGGTMCPSYMATRDERDTTRARANVLRRALTQPRNPARPFESLEVSEVMDLCLSCKACKSECPSGVDMARLKAETLQQRHDAHGIPLRTRLIGNYSRLSSLGMLSPRVHNWLVGVSPLSGVLKRAIGFAPQRSLPKLPSMTLRQWHARHANRRVGLNRGRVFLFCDEFTNYHDAHVGIKAVGLLNGLGYEVLIPRHGDSGRAHFSKGLLHEARALAIRNVELLSDVVSDGTPLIGIEPSAILGFRDEYPDIVPDRLVSSALSLAPNALLFDEFLSRESDRGRIGPEAFTDESRLIRLHGHCQQKALASNLPTVRALSLPRNYKVSVIPSGCCGMAGSFGYESEHYGLAMQVGELVLLPAVRDASPETIIAAPGTSCRHQIKDGTGRTALHAAEILHDALIRP
jgi:FAD/FMN-containing dehydrogenase/Fe-S oxidoreductase